MRYFLIASFLLICVCLTAQEEKPFDKRRVHTELITIKQNDPDSALNLAKRYLKEAAEINWLPGMARIRVSMLTIYRVIGEYELGYQLAMENQQLFAQWASEITLEDQTYFQILRGDNFHEVATILMNQGQLDSALLLDHKALKTYRGISTDIDSEIKDIQVKISVAMQVLGGIFYYQGKVDTALTIFIDVQKILEKYLKPSAVFTGYLNIGNMYLSKGDDGKALEYYLRGLEIAESEEADALEGQALGYVGQAYFKQHEFEKSLYYSLQGMRIFKSMGIKSDWAFFSAHVADSYQELSQFDSALYFYEEALRIDEEIGNIDEQAYSLSKISRIWIDKENYKKALTYIDRGLHLIKDEDIYEERLLLYTSKVECLLQLGLESEALIYANRLTQIVKETDNIPYQSEAFGSIHKAMKANGRNAAAYDALLNFKTAQDSLNNEEKARDLARVEYEYELDKERNKAQAEQEKQELVFRQTLEKERWIQYSAFGGLALVLIIVAILYRSYRVKQSDNKRLADQNIQIKQLRDSEKKMSEETIALKERELTTITMLSHERNSLLEELNTQIGSLSSKVDEDVIPELKGIRKTISANLNEESWSLFTYHFENVHPKFFNSLKESYSSLTQNDLRLCAYVRVGMSNKEIANISNITTDAVKKSLQRMKKKMSLTVEDDLRAFLMSL